MLKQKLNRGFTVIELLVVLVLIGIFSAIAYPNINSWIIDREIKKEVYDVVSLIEKKKSEVVNGKYGMIQIRLKQRVEIYTMSQDDFFNTYKNINVNNKFKNNSICDFQWRGMSNLKRDRTSEILLSDSVNKNSKVNVWPNPAHNPGETVLCITKDGNIKFINSNPNETDPKTGKKVDLFIFCSEKNTNQRTCKRNITNDYQYKITWDRFANLKIYKYLKKKE